MEPNLASCHLTEAGPKAVAKRHNFCFLTQLAGEGSPFEAAVSPQAEESS